MMSSHGVQSSRFPVPPGKEELGNHTWTLLHTMAAYWPQNPPPQQVEDGKKFISLLSRLYPCTDCAGHFREKLKYYPPRLETQQSFIKWLSFFHNTVNKRLGKPMFDPNDHQKRWWTENALAHEDEEQESKNPKVQRQNASQVSHGRYGDHGHAANESIRLPPMPSLSSYTNPSSPPSRYRARMTDPSRLRRRPLESQFSHLSLSEAPLSGYDPDPFSQDVSTHSCDHCGGSLPLSNDLSVNIGSNESPMYDRVFMLRHTGIQDGRNRYDIVASGPSTLHDYDSSSNLYPRNR